MSKRGRYSKLLRRPSKTLIIFNPQRFTESLLKIEAARLLFSALGQQAPLEEKEKWTEEENDKRLKLVARLNSYLPDMEAKVAGLTSIDVTKKELIKNSESNRL